MMMNLFAWSNKNFNEMRDADKNGGLGGRNGMTFISVSIARVPFQIPKSLPMIAIQSCMNASRIPGIHEHLTVELWANFRD
jgi:hypothetical protein